MGPRRLSLGRRARGLKTASPGRSVWRAALAWPLVWISGRAILLIIGRGVGAGRADVPHLLPHSDLGRDRARTRGLGAGPTEAARLGLELALPDVVRTPVWVVVVVAMTLVLSLPLAQFFDKKFPGRRAPGAH